MTRNCAGANAGAPFSENVMIIWDEDDVWGPNKNTRCAICHDRLRLPVVMWDAGYIDDEGYVVPHTAYVCNECCIRMCHGLHADMTKIIAAKKIEKFGFHCSAMRARGGFLCTTGTGTEQ